MTCEGGRGCPKKLSAIFHYACVREFLRSICTSLRSFTLPVFSLRLNKCFLLVSDATAIFFRFNHLSSILGRFLL